MVHISVIEARLSKLGVRISRWFRPEIRELQHIMMDHERLITVVPGRYFGGFALLVSTDQRLLLIDKRSFFLTLEDIRYDMISETDFSARLFDSTLHIFTVNKQHRFTSMKYKHQLRALTSYTQQRIMELRQPTVQSTPMEIYQGAPPVFRSAQTPRLSSYTLPRSPRTHGAVGAAAINGVNKLNPYVKSALSMRSGTFIGSHLRRTRQTAEDNLTY